MHRSNVWLALTVALALAGGCDSGTTSTPPDDGPSPDQVLDSSVADAGLPDRGADLTAADGPVPDGLLADGPRADAPLSAQPLQAGAAAVDITPPTSAGVPLAGFGGSPRREFTLLNIPAHLAAALGNCYDPNPADGVASLFAPAQGKHDPIMARALVLDNGVTRAAIIKLDTIGVTRKLRDDVELEALKLGIPKQNLIVAATHTHSGPGAVNHQLLFQLIATDCFHAPTYQTVLTKIVTALQQAAAALKPAAIGIGSTTETRVSKNRMGNPVLDTELGLIKITSAQGGQPIAAVLSFAVHGTCLGASNMLFSADLMGQAEGALEQQLGGGVALFLNGAEADVSPTQGGFNGAATLGGYLADSAHTLWGGLATSSALEIEGVLVDVTMPPATYKGCLPLMGDGNTLCDYVPGLTLPVSQWMQKVLPFGALRLGDVVLATVPGEASTTLGLQIKAAGQALGYRKTYVVGLANDYMGYATTQAEYQTDEYEAQSTLYGPGTGAKVVSEATARITAVRPAGWPDGGAGPADASVGD